MWNLWVQNHVEKVRNLVLARKWFYVMTNVNPVDIGTRSRLLSTIVFYLWWKEEDKGLEEKESQNVVLSLAVESKNIGNVINCGNNSSMDKLLRVKGYVFPFIFNLHTKDNFKSGDISTEEINSSKKLWIKHEQSYIINSAKFGKNQNSLKLFCDDENILRSNTRISNFENFNYDKKYPILLRNDSYFSKLVILKTHEDHLHCGVNSTLAFIHSNYWIIRGRQTIKNILKTFVICKIVQGKTVIPPETAKLPYFRVSCDHSFENVWIDYAGPLYSKGTVKGKTVISKCYILLFTCAVTRAVHLELTPDESTHMLILALQRFISRRGYAKLFISDNFQSFKSKDIKNYLRKHNISWQFILKKSPWGAGFTNDQLG